MAVVRYYTTDDPDRRPDIWASSLPLGTSMLDSQIGAVLPEHKASWLRSCGPAFRLPWRMRLYSEQVGYYAAELDDEIGNEHELTKIRDVLDSFSAQIGNAVTRLIERVPVADCQDVVLTGGGCKIPRLRNGVLSAVARHFGAGYLVHGPEGTPSRSSKTVIPDRIVRGGTALGGASVFFDKSFH